MEYWRCWWHLLWKIGNETSKTLLGEYYRVLKFIFTWKVLQDRQSRLPGPQQPSTEHWSSQTCPSWWHLSGDLLFCSKVLWLDDFMILDQLTSWAKHNSLFSRIATLPDRIFRSDRKSRDVSDVLTMYSDAKYSVRVLPPTTSRFLNALRVLNLGCWAWMLRKPVTSLMVESTSSFTGSSAGYLGPKVKFS